MCGLFFYEFFTPNLENTVILFLADHSQKMGSFFNTETGIRENLMPHLFMLTPRKLLLKKFPELDSVLMVNQNKLSTPHDVHVPLKHLAVYPHFPKGVAHIII